MRKISPLNALFIAQFLSAFVDNMILFIVQGIIQHDAYPSYYLSFVQSTFLASYIIFSPWVGRFADRKPKTRVLMTGNFIKTVGVLLLITGVNPAICYAVVGTGAVIYSPAKYGILPFLTQNDKELLKANSGLESYTILAILLGSVAGGYLADFSILLGLIACVVLYAASIGVNTLIPEDAGNASISYKRAVSEFILDAGTLFRNPQSHYSLLGTGSFWMASAMLRMIIFAWVPLKLGFSSGMAISMIISVTGIGIAVGAVITPYIISIRTYQRTIWFGLAMGLTIFAFLGIASLPVAICFLLLIGILGGIYIVPMNACLQQVGHQTVGAGKTIAVQNFMENTFMFLGVSAYALATKVGISVDASLAGTAILFLCLAGYMLWFLRKENRR